MSITLSETEQVFFVGQVVFAQEAVFGNKLNKYFLFFFFFGVKKGVVHCALEDVIIAASKGQQAKRDKPCLQNKQRAVLIDCLLRKQCLVNVFGCPDTAVE